ncbi:hypothetical protein H9Q69_010662 [Fusarium xylarioides]|nr:hypothetical protein H9Q69_010662 [Fusarium xylarioides]KAG5805718.1 hypothetical protein H9Q71_009704 [Fusarium xylarioides]KAG5824744.1 hypothetical protein H9Q74_005151 [Fusarium xylarioides]
MPESSRTIVFTRKGNTPGNQEKVQKLANEWKGNGVQVEVGPDEITFTMPPGGGDCTAKHFQGCMEKEGLWDDWKEGHK